MTKDTDKSSDNSLEPDNSSEPGSSPEPEKGSESEKSLEPNNSSEPENQKIKTENLKDSDLGLLVSSTLHKLEHISDHHVKERRHHFRITNIYVGIISALILIIAVFNLYYIYDFYKETMNIINTIHALDDTVKIISDDMVQVTSTMAKFKSHMGNMQGIYADVSSMSDVMPLMENNMSGVKTDMGHLNQNMQEISSDMSMIDFHLKNMSGNVTHMEKNIHDMARPMGKFNSILP